MKPSTLLSLALAGTAIAQTPTTSASSATYTNPILNETGADP